MCSKCGKRSLITNPQNCEERLLALSCLSLSLCLRLSLCPHSITLILLDGFSWNLIFEFFRKSFKKIQVHSNLTRITGTLHEGPSTFMITSRLILLKVRNVSDECCTENQNTRFMSNNFIFFRKTCRLWEKVENYGRVGRATRHYNTAPALCVLDSLQTNTQNMQYLLLFHGNHSYANAPHCYVICILPVLFKRNKIKINPYSVQ